MTKTFSWVCDTTTLMGAEHPVAWIERAFTEDVQHVMQGMFAPNADRDEVQRKAQALADQAERDAYWQGYTDAGLATREQILAMGKHPYLVTHGSRMFAKAYMAGFIAGGEEEVVKGAKELREAQWGLARHIVQGVLLAAAVGFVLWAVL